MSRARPESLIEEVSRWAATRSDIRALALVGSHARGDARPDSDVDLVLLCSEPEQYLKDTAWTASFGEVATLSREDWGKVQSIRIFYRSGLEVEFGVTTPDWAAIPLDGGTVQVAQNGMRILLDPDGLLLRLGQLAGARD